MACSPPVAFSPLGLGPGATSVVTWAAFAVTAIAGLVIAIAAPPEVRPLTLVATGWLIAFLAGISATATT